MSGPGESRDAREWRRFFRSTLRKWRGQTLLRAMDRHAFDDYSDGSRAVQESITLFADARAYPDAFILDVSPSLMRLIGHMYASGDDITAFLLARALGDIQEDRGLDEAAARALQFAGRCARVMRFYGEAQYVLERARRCALRIAPDHPILIETHNLLGLVCHFTDRLDDAEGHYLRSLELLDRWPALTVRHHAWQSKSRLKGMRLTNLLDLHLVRARLLSGEAKVREIEAARRLQDQVRQGSPGEPAVMGLHDANEGEILFVEGRLKEAKALLHQRMRQCDADSPMASHLLPPTNRLLAQIAAEEGDEAEAYAHSREGLQLSLRYANSMEEGLLVETTLQIMGRFMRPRVAGAGVSAVGPQERRVIQNLVLLLESKDWYTGNNHSRAVSRLCRTLGYHLQAVAEAAGHPPAVAADKLDVESLEMAGLLHDIGKLRIPWSLLNKRNPLVPFEQGILQSHVPEGVSILRQLGFEELARLVEEHHEKLDGSGYPERRRQLSLMGAVIAVSDAFEAMITPNRRYAQPKKLAATLAELHALSGVHYDPRVVAALERQMASRRT
jgi:putative nucleotidyltransferase with HDIG domain